MKWGISIKFCYVFGHLLTARPTDVNIVFFFVEPYVDICPLYNKKRKSLG